MSYKVGDRGAWRPVGFGSETDIDTDRGFVRARAKYPGTVTYVHPSGRWYQVTFDCGPKECFFEEVPYQRKKGREPGHMF